jgi:hypothetical protein
VLRRNADFNDIKKSKGITSIVGICSLRITYDGLIFSSSLEEVKDEICVTCEKHNGRSCLSIQD